MKKRLFIILQCLLFILLFTGCWSREEPKSLAMVNSVLYDIDDKGQNLATIEVINTTSQGAGGGKGGAGEEKTSALIIEEKGHFTADTVYRDNNNLEKVVFAGLNKARFFSEKLAVSGIHSNMDYIARDLLTDETPFMVVVLGKDPKRLYNCTTGMTDMMGNYIDNLQATQPKVSNESVFVRTLDFMKDFYIDGKEPVMGLAQIQESDVGLSDSFQSGAQITQTKKNPSSQNQGGSSQGNSDQNTSGQGAGQGTNQASPSPSQGAGQGSKDTSNQRAGQGANQASPSPSKNAGQGSKDTSNQGAGQGANQASPSPSKNAGQASPSPSPLPGNVGPSQSDPTASNQNQKIYHISYEGLAAFKGDKLVGYMNGNEARTYNILTNNYGSSVVIAPVGNNYGVFTIQKGKTKIKTNVGSNGQIEIKVTIKPIISIRQINDASLDIRKDSVIKTMEQAVSRQLQTEVTKAIEKAQTQFKSDIFGFGIYVHIQHPKDFYQIKDKWNDSFEKAKINVIVESSITREGKVRHPFAMED